MTWQSCNSSHNLPWNQSGVSSIHLSWLVAVRVTVFFLTHPPTISSPWLVVLFGIEVSNWSVSPQASQWEELESVEEGMSIFVESVFKCSHQRSWMVLNGPVYHKGLFGSTTLFTLDHHLDHIYHGVLDLDPHSVPSVKVKTCSAATVWKEPRTSCHGDMCHWFGFCCINTVAVDVVQTEQEVRNSGVKPGPVLNTCVSVSTHCYYILCYINCC